MFLFAVAWSGVACLVVACWVGVEVRIYEIKDC